MFLKLSADSCHNWIVYFWKMNIDHVVSGTIGTVLNWQTQWIQMSSFHKKYELCSNYEFHSSMAFVGSHFSYELPRAKCDGSEARKCCCAAVPIWRENKSNRRIRHAKETKETKQSTNFDCADIARLSKRTILGPAAVASSGDNTVIGLIDEVTA